MALRYLSIDKDTQKKIKDMVSKKYSGHKIAAILKISQPKIWRNMEIMGLNKKMGAIKGNINGKFNLEEFKKHYKY